MYFILVLDNGQTFDFNEKCEKFSGAEDDLVTFKDATGGVLACLPMKRVAAIVRSDCKDFCSTITPVPFF